MNAIRLDVERFVEWPLLESILFGGQFNRNKEVSKAFRSTAAGIDLSKINPNSPFLHAGGNVDDFFGGHASGFQKNWTTTDLS